MVLHTGMSGGGLASPQDILHSNAVSNGVIVCSKVKVKLPLCLTKHHTL